MSKLNEKEYQAQYYKNNLEKITRRKKQYREDNREKVKKQRKQSYKNNREETLKRVKKYRENHLEWTICPDCGKGRWLYKGESESFRCHKCGAKRGKDSSNWTGGRHLDSHGYIRVWLDPTSPYYSMKPRHNYICEHRLVIAQHLGRCLTSKEKVHHRGIKYPVDSMENRQDNRIENLKLCNGNGEHLILHRKFDNKDDLLYMDTNR